MDSAGEGNGSYSMFVLQPLGELPQMESSYRKLYIMIGT